jgi:hypothetical protein
LSYSPSAEGQWIETTPLPKKKKNKKKKNKKNKIALSFEEEIPFDCF